MKYRFVILTVFCLLATPGLRAQAPSGNGTGSPPGEPEKRKAAEGTFEVIRESKITELLNTDLLYTIEAQRGESEVVYFRVSEHTLIRILPKSQINAPGFVPLRHLYADEAKMEGGTK